MWWFTLLAITWMFLNAFLAMCHEHYAENTTTFVINTWNFSDATVAASAAILLGNSALDAIEVGCSLCQRVQCGGTVGFGGSPDENGETTLDALIIDGTTFNVGAVGCLRKIKNAIGVARKILEHTHHSLLVGELATSFAVQMGFTEEFLNTSSSNEMWRAWKNRNCQPNFWNNVIPNVSNACRPHKYVSSIKIKQDLFDPDINIENHDTIGMVAIDNNGNIAAGTSTNGLKFKIPGRVGDSPIPGAGAYADSDVGGAAATGDGDIMMRMLPSFVAVEEMRRSARVQPTEAAKTAILRISVKFPNFSGAVIALRKDGTYGAACHGMKEFPFSVSKGKYGNVTVERISCLHNR